MAYIYNLIDTWNNAGTTFTAIKMNVTDTNSSASSLLMDLQVGAVTQFNVRKDGSVYTPNGIVAMGVSGAGPLYISTNSSAVGYNMASGLGVGWTNSATNAVGAPDTILRRDAANTLALRNSTAAQAFNIYDTYTDVSNYSRLVMYSAGSGSYYIGTQKAGTGTSISLFVGTGAGSGVAGHGQLTLAGSSIQFATQIGNVFSITSAGAMSWNTDNTYDIGASGASRPRNVYIAGQMIGGPGSASAPTFAFNDTNWGSGLSGMFYAGNGVAFGGAGGIYHLSISNQALTLSSGHQLAWSSGNGTPGSGDTFLSRRGAANLRLGAGDAAAPVAQTLSVQSVVAGTSNTAGANWTFTGSQGTGTGAGGSFIFQVAPAGSTGTAQNALATALTLTSAGTLVFPNSLSPSTLIQFQYADYGIGSNANGEAVIRINTAARATIGTILRVWSGGTYAWSAGDSNAASDLILARDDANILAQRNSTAAQTFRLYNTFTDVSNYERGFVKWASNVLQIGTEKLGTGTARALEFQTNGTTKLTITTTAGSAQFGAGPSNQFGWYNAYGNLVFEAWESSGVRRFVVNGLLLFEGTSSSFPALKRSSTTLQARLADDSGFANLAAAQVTIPLQTLTDGANVAWNCNNGAKAKVTLGGNRTIDAVTNAVEGTSYTLWVIQDATGSRTVTWTTSGAGSFDFGTEGTPVLTTTASAADALGFEAISIGGTLKLRFMGIKRGFA